MIQFRRKNSQNANAIVFATMIDDEMRSHFGVSVIKTHNIDKSLPREQIQKLRRAANEWYLDWYNICNIELQTGKSIQEIMKRVKDPCILEVLHWLDDNFIPVILRSRSEMEAA